MIFYDIMWYDMYHVHDGIVNINPRFLDRVKILGLQTWHLCCWVCSALAGVRNLGIRVSFVDKSHADLQSRHV